MLVSCAQIYYRAKETGTPSNRKCSGLPVLFTDAEKQELIAFFTRDRITRRLSWEEFKAEMGYACSPETVQRVVQSLGYYKRIPRRKFNLRQTIDPVESSGPRRSLMDVRGVEAGVVD